MLKEIIICGVIIISILIGNFITQDYTKETVSEITSGLTSLKEQLTQVQINNETVKNENLKVNEKWQERHDKLAYYIEHNELEKIETSLNQIQSNIETGEYEDCINEIEKSIFLLGHVEDRYAFNLKNIF